MVLNSKSNVKKFLKQVHEKAIPKNKNLLTMKIPHISIKFPLDSSYQNIFNKCEYYFEIEKIMLSKSKNFFRKLYFVAYRLLVLIKFITKKINEHTGFPRVSCCLVEPWLICGISEYLEFRCSSWDAAGSTFATVSNSTLTFQLLEHAESQRAPHRTPQATELHRAPQGHREP